METKDFTIELVNTVARDRIPVGYEWFPYLGSKIEELRRNRKDLEEALRKYPGNYYIITCSLDLTKEPTLYEKPSQVLKEAIGKYRQQCILSANGYHGVSIDCGVDGIGVDENDYEDWHCFPRFPEDRKGILRMDRFDEKFSGYLVAIPDSERKTLNVSLSQKTYDSLMEIVDEFSKHEGTCKNVEGVLRMSLSFLNELRFNHDQRYCVPYFKGDDRRDSIELYYC